ACAAAGYLLARLRGGPNRADDDQRRGGTGSNASRGQGSAESEVHEKIESLLGFAGAGGAGAELTAGAGVSRKLLSWGVAAVLAMAFILLTAARNRAYASDLALWSDTVAKSPGNELALHNL